MNRITIIFCLTLSFQLVFQEEIYSQNLLDQKIDSLFDSLPRNAHQAEPFADHLKKLGLLLSENKQIPFYHRIGKYYHASEMFDSASVYLKKGLYLANKKGDDYYISMFHIQLSRIQVAKAMYSEALDNLIIAKNVYADKDSLIYLSDLYRSIGNAYWGMSIYDKALENYFQSLDFAKEGISQDEETSIYNQAAVYNNIGLIYRSIGDTINELGFFKKSFNQASPNGDSWLSAISANNLGNYYHDREQYDSALYFYEYSGKIAEKLGGLYHQGITLSNRGQIYLKIDSVETARRHLKQALDLAYQTDDHTGISNCLIALGNSYLKENLPDIAKPLIDSGLRIAIQIKSFSLQKDAFLLKTEYFIQKKQIDSAFRNQEQVMSIMDSLSVRKNSEGIRRLEYKYLEKQSALEIEAMKKQRKIVNLLIFHIVAALLVIIIVIWNFLVKTRRSNKILEEQKKEIQKQQNLLHIKNNELIVSKEKLQNLNYGKDRFIAIISHDLKNPVSAIRGFTELLIRDYDNLSEEKKKLFLQQVYESVEKTSLLINNILYWVRSQNNGMINKPQLINLNKSIHSNISLYTIIAKDKGITIENGLPLELNITADPNMFDTIIRNLLSNSIKFTSRGGKISFSAYPTNTTIELQIKDNGTGISKEKLEEIFSNKDTSSLPGTKKEPGTGLGLNLVREFSEILNAEFSIESEPGKGTEFRLSFKKS